MSDGYDVVFLVVMRFLDSIMIPKDVKEYVCLCKDLFYYRCKVKTKQERANLIFYSIFVITQRRVTVQSIDQYWMGEDGGTLGKTDYLFVWINYDEELCKEVRNECELKKKYSYPEKPVCVEDAIYKVCEKVDIIKI